MTANTWIAIAVVALFAVLIGLMKLIIQGEVEGWWDDDDF